MYIFLASRRTTLPARKNRRRGLILSHSNPPDYCLLARSCRRTDRRAWPFLMRPFRKYIVNPSLPFPPVFAARFRGPVDPIPCHKQTFITSHRIASHRRSYEGGVTLQLCQCTCTDTAIGFLVIDGPMLLCLRHHATTICARTHLSASLPARPWAHAPPPIPTSHYRVDAIAHILTQSCLKCTVKPHGKLNIRKREGKKKTDAIRLPQAYISEAILYYANCSRDASYPPPSASLEPRKYYLLFCKQGPTSVNRCPPVPHTLYHVLSSCGRTAYLAHECCLRS